MGEELERMHPRIYSNVSRQLSRAAFGELQVRDRRGTLIVGAIFFEFRVCGRKH